MSTHNICFRGEIWKILMLFGKKKKKKSLLSGAMNKRNIQVETITLKLAEIHDILKHFYFATKLRLDILFKLEMKCQAQISVYSIIVNEKYQ